MGEILLVALALTSAAAYVLGRRRLGLPAAGLARAASAMLEVVGLTVVFLALDLGVAVAAILGSRALGTPLSLYLATEKLWLLPALLQALVFHAWWRGTGRLDSAAGSGVDMRG